jgi:hypothetical protein
MPLYYVTSPEAAARIAQHGFQEEDLHRWSHGVQLRDIRPDEVGGAWRQPPAEVEVNPEGVRVTPSPRVCLWADPDTIRWLRVLVHLTEAELEPYHLIAYQTPQELTPEELLQRARDQDAGLIPPDPVNDWGYQEYHIPLEVLRQQAQIEGPFRCDEELEEDEEER